MKIRKANAVWRGDLKSGNGELQFGKKPTRMDYSFASRFEEGGGTNPEELIGAALAGCYAMALSHALAEKGNEPVRVDITAAVHFDKAEGGFEIPSITLRTEAEIKGIDEEEFRKVAEDVSKACPVAKALRAVTIEVEARLV